jgi:hypothetical protein
MIKFPDRNTQSSERIKFYFATKALGHNGYLYFFYSNLVFVTDWKKLCVKQGKVNSCLSRNKVFCSRLLVRRSLQAKMEGMREN